ncbi:MAG TPA: methyltransferase domain-containing protein [Gemmatimonadota bacterium]|nr:methyltransferase domain-containing protein [Gemmatimonadota bacterium]
MPWQLVLFEKSLKKKQKLELILSQLRETAGKDCLLVTHGDNTGALNHHLRLHGGNWTWVENEREKIEEMSRFLGEPVLPGTPSGIPVEDESFDVVVSIDVHEHLDDCRPFNRELRRVVRPGGTVVVSTPTGDAWKPVTVLKHLVGMTKERYGHRVIGYTIRQHRTMLREAGLEPQTAGTYSRFFTELLELAINFAYVRILSRKSPPTPGTIAPSTSVQLRAVDRQVRVYSAVYPLLWSISRLDRLLFFFKGYAVSVVARRPDRN